MVFGYRASKKIDLQPIHSKKKSQRTVLGPIHHVAVKMLCRILLVVLQEK